MKTLLAEALLCGLILGAIACGFRIPPEIIPCPPGQTGTFPNCVVPTPPPPPPDPTWCPVGEEWNADLGHCVPVVVVPPPPPPNPQPTLGCTAPQGSWVRPKPTTLVARAEIVKVLRELGGCTEGSSCPLPHDNQQSWQAKVVAELRARGLCAGQHEEGITDEIAVIPLGGSQCGRWEAYKVFACTPPRPGEPSTLDTCPMVGRGKVRWAIPSESYTPGPECEWLPAPTVCDSPTPGPLGRWEVKVHVRGPNWTTYDSTPLVGPDADFCKAIGYTDGRWYCPPRTEGGAEAQAEIGACNALVVGDPTNYPAWYWNERLVPSGGLDEGVVHDENPYHLLVRPELRGSIKVCSQSSVCGSVQQ